MIGKEDSDNTYEYKKYYKILPVIHNWSKDPVRIGNGKLVQKGFVYSSEKNTNWMKSENLRKWIKKNKNDIGNF